MSLWCGSCRGEIFGGFGLLYQLKRTGDGKFRYPDKAGDYVPPNSAVCDECWNHFPLSEQHASQKAEIAAEQDKETVFAYAPADSNNDPFWGSKTWSGIVTDEDKLVFIAPEMVARYFPGVMEIIDASARSHPEKPSVDGIELRSLARHVS